MFSEPDDALMSRMLSKALNHTSSEFALKGHDKLPYDVPTSACARARNDGFRRPKVRPGRRDGRTCNGSHYDSSSAGSVVAVERYNVCRQLASAKNHAGYGDP